MTKSQARYFRRTALAAVERQFPGYRRTLALDVQEELLAAQAAWLVLTQAGDMFGRAQELIRAVVNGPDEETT